MCSIMTCYQSSVSPDTGGVPEAFLSGFDRTKSRGPDDSRIVERDGVLMAFHRLAIMGLTDSGMQPFALDGSYVVCNGELYGFEKEREALAAFLSALPPQRFNVLRQRFLNAGPGAPECFVIQRQRDSAPHSPSG